MRGSFWLDSAESAGGDFSARVFPYSAVQKYLRLMLRHNTKFEAALHRGHTFAHANPKLSATSTGADLELMRQNDALPYSALLICCAATFWAPIFRLELGEVWPSGFMCLERDCLNQPAGRFRPS